MSCLIFYVDNDNELKLNGLVNPADTPPTPINDATVQATLYDGADVELTGQVWPLALAYVAGSNGDYKGTVDAAVVSYHGLTGKAVITATRSGLEAEYEFDFIFVTRRTTYLTSQTELEDMFGTVNVATWADLENAGSASDKARRIYWAIEEATAEATSRLRGGPGTNFCANDRLLRQNATRLAGVLLYESRGVKDTADEEGRHRLKWHRDRADSYFQRVNAGVLHVETSAAKGSYPEAVLTDEDDYEVNPLNV